MTGLVIDTQDESFARSIRALGLEVRVMQTVMKGPGDRRCLAEGVLKFAAEGALPPDGGQ
jgi:hypothetical protein